MHFLHCILTSCIVKYLIHAIKSWVGLIFVRGRPHIMVLVLLYDLNVVIQIKVCFEMKWFNFKILIFVRL